MLQRKIMLKNVRQLKDIDLDISFADLDYRPYIHVKFGYDEQMDDLCKTIYPFDRKKTSLGIEKDNQKR